MAENKVSVEITLEEKAALSALTKLSKEINKTETNFTKMGKEGDEALGVVGQASKGVADGFGSLVKGVTVANLASEAIIGTANAIKGFVVDSVNAAIEAEESNQRLAQSLRVTGSFSLETMESFKAFASQLAQTSIHGDDTIISMLALAKSMGATNEQAKNMVRAGVELSATFGGSIEERVSQLGKTLTGTGGKLDTLIPGFKSLTEAQLKSGEAFQFVNDKFGGAAVAQLDTYGGKLNQLKKAYGELQEAAGGFIVESGFSDSFVKATKLIDLLVKSMAESKIESQRAAGGFTETSESIKQLEGKYRDLWIEAQQAKEVINNPSFFDQLLARPLAAADNLKRLNAEMAATKALIDQAAPKVEEAKANSPDSRAVSSVDQAAIDKERATQAEIFAIREQARIAQLEQEALIEAEKAGKNELELQQIYEFEAQKLEAQFQAEEAKAALIKNSSERQLKEREILAKRELEFTKLDNKRYGDEAKRRVATTQEMNQSLVGASQNFLSAGISMAKEGSVAQKAMQIMQATISTYTAANNALATVPYPANVAAASGLIAVGLANVAKIAGAKFEHGGIVPGNSMAGDSISARLNSGEMVLNRQQQTQLFNMANGQGGSSGVMEAVNKLIDAVLSQPINLVVDGRQIATVVRREVQGGFRLG